MQPITEPEIAAHSRFPRITPDQLDAQIRSVAFDYHDLTVKCTIIMQNGYGVHGESGCAVPGNYKRETGERLAYNDAKNKMWQLLGYELKTKVALALEASPPSQSDAKTYVGTKVVHAIPMNRADYNEVRSWALPDNEDGSDEGFLVEYPDQPSNCEGFNGYVSWSPKGVFEASYEEMNVRGEGAEGGPTWLDRLHIEREELKGRVDKLRAFITGTLFTGLGQDQRELLTQQYEVMNTYLDILDTRMAG